MYSNTKRNALLSLVFMLAFVLACGALSDDTEKANKLVAEGNTLIDEGNKLATDGGAKNDKVFDELTPNNYDADKEKLTPTAKEAVDLLTKAADKYRDASKKFDEASKLKINDKFKDYLNLKSQEFSKRAEQVDASKKNSQAMLDSSDGKALLAAIQSNKPKLEALDKEAKDIEAKAEKIRTENKDLIK